MTTRCVHPAAQITAYICRSLLTAHKQPASTAHFTAAQRRENNKKLTTVLLKCCVCGVQPADLQSGCGSVCSAPASQCQPDDNLPGKQPCGKCSACGLKAFGSVADSCSLPMTRFDVMLLCNRLLSCVSWLGQELLSQVHRYPTFNETAAPSSLQSLIQGHVMYVSQCFLFRISQ